MSQTRPDTSEELLETIQNTDPVSDPADDLTTGIEGHEHTAGTAAHPATTLDASDEEVERLRAERDALVDRLARLQAEFENARRRADKERSEFREYATGNAVEQFLPVLDNFQLALKSNGTAEQLRSGVELIAKQMEEAFRTLNVLPVATAGVAFDPRVHEALGSVESTELPDGQVYEEVRRGYRIKERLLRPALVRIVSNPQQTQA
ncbi:nucleotide exchange factor GrpE [Acidipila sp. EB88]|uniref:nucleotide exchange factor GrpE n=1 Tax=Acidipila sp. EB88 TaxID=2305226 RepID=UPI000F5E18A9|nr:nucleotide exchange factor GrpE [Acidipila sp. EB88]RRA50095.1 nucleotide exchange factor GrpE [Acidipila sp. EB88]